MPIQFACLIVAALVLIGIKAWIFGYVVGFACGAKAEREKASTDDTDGTVVLSGFIPLEQPRQDMNPLARHRMGQ